jgi:MHS family proline/betaine transporter-like MFS transporter
MRGTSAATRLIIASSVGNALEFYEILVYGYFAVTISRVFFPTANEAVSILVTLGTFGVSFLARPVGAIFLGAYGDRKGRKRALTLSILLMTIGTGLMTVMPSYGSVGLLAPVLVIAARLLQGFSVGGEFASSTAFLVEHRPDSAGFFASWQWSSQGLAALVATGFGVLLTTSMAADTLQAWGWRIPFAFGLLIGPVGYYIRNQLAETPEFIEAGQAQSPLRDLFVGQWDRLVLLMAPSPPRPVHSTSWSTCRPTRYESSTCRNRSVLWLRLAPRRCRRWRCRLSESGSTKSARRG